MGRQMNQKQSSGAFIERMIENGMHASSHNIKIRVCQKWL